MVGPTRHHACWKQFFIKLECLKILIAVGFNVLGVYRESGMARPTRHHACWKQTFITLECLKILLCFHVLGVCRESGTVRPTRHHACWKQTFYYAGMSKKLGSFGFNVLRVYRESGTVRPTRHHACWKQTFFFDGMSKNPSSRWFQCSRCLQGEWNGESCATWCMMKTNIMAPTVSTPKNSLGGQTGSIKPCSSNMPYLVHVLFKPFNLSNVDAQNQSLFKQCNLSSVKNSKSGNISKSGN